MCKKKTYYFKLFLVLVLLSLVNVTPSLAEDIIRITKPHSPKDQRHIYVNTILSKALEATTAEYGKFRIERTLQGVARDRSLLEMISGKNINVHIVPTQDIWEKKTIPIRIPILKGLLGFRLFLIKQQNMETFSNIKSMEELKSLKAGLRQQWSTTRAMKYLGFNVVVGTHYEGLFAMLIKDRFDYFPRGINEIFLELENHNKELPDLAIEATKALYLPLPYYIFVSPKYPRLAKRLEKGLHKIIDNGKFDEIFMKYNKSFIEQANLTQRHIFYIDNPLLSIETPFYQTKYWFYPLNK